MPRRKAAENCTVLPWLSGKPDNREKRFLQVGNTLLFVSSFQSLSAGAKHLYLCMAMESGGRRDFVFPHAAAKKYGFAARSFDRYVAELVRAGFLECASMKNLRQPNKYRFSLQWKR